MEPTDGLSDHVTAWFEAPRTDAAKICVCDGVSSMLTGVRVTLTDGVNDMLALADSAGLATLVAVNFTICEVGMLDGAV